MKPPAWTFPEEILVEQLWGKITLREISVEVSKLGNERSEHAVYRKGQKLGLPKVGPRTEAARAALAKKLKEPPAPKEEPEDIFAIQPIPRPALGPWGLCW